MTVYARHVFALLLVSNTYLYAETLRVSHRSGREEPRMTFQLTDHSAAAPVSRGVIGHGNLSAYDSIGELADESPIGSLGIGSIPLLMDHAAQRSPKTDGSLVVGSNGPFALSGLQRDGSTLSAMPTARSSQEPATNQDSADPFARWNELKPKTWWRDSAPYSCHETEKQTSPWLRAGLIDLGGSDPLSLIRYSGNGSYLRYGHMGFYGCTELTKFPGSFHLDPPADPTYYSVGDLEIWVDIARVPEDASGWHADDGTRVDMSMQDAVLLLNTHVAPYFRRISDDNLRIIFLTGNEFTVGGNGGPDDAEKQQANLIGACLDGCEFGSPGGLNRILLTDVAADTGGRAYNGWAAFGLASFRDANMETIVHEMGHGWMAWPHSYSEVPWRAGPDDEISAPNPYSNLYDVMSSLALVPVLGWGLEMPSTLAINRYAAGWIRPEDVALHLVDSATYTLSKPREAGYQFVVVHSGRPYAFTTLEVLEERSSTYRPPIPVYDPSVATNYRPRRYEGVLVSRYDQTAGTGTQARVGPALYHKENPESLTDVGWAQDDFSVIGDGETREIGGGVSVQAKRNDDGSYDVTVEGGTVAEFEVWCSNIWFSLEYDTGCYLDEAIPTEKSDAPAVSPKRIMASGGQAR